MQFGLVISVLMHVAILVGALVSIHSRPELRMPEIEPVAVGMISPGEVTKVRLGSRTAKQLEAAANDSPDGDVAKKEAAKTKMAAAAPPPPPPPPPPPVVPEPKVEPAPAKLAEPPPVPAPSPPAPPPPAAAAEAQKKLEAEQEERDRLAAEQKAEEQRQADEQRRAEEAKRAEEQKKAEEQRRQAELKKKRDEEKKRREAALKKKREEEKKKQEAEAAKSKFNADKIAALLNKVPTSAAPPPPSEASNDPTKAKGPVLGAREGKDKQLSASEAAMIGQIIKSCVIPNWTVLSGGASAQETAVKIRLQFNEDGTFSVPPQLMNAQAGPYFQAISESALRAVQQCEPYNLPADKYQFWKDVVMTFSPRDMF